MRNLKLSVVGLIVGLSLFFMLERLNFGEAGVVNIQSFVYPLGVVATLAVLLVPLFSRISLSLMLLIWTGIYLLLKLFVFDSRPLIGNYYTFVTITEIGLLGLLVTLGYQFRRIYQEYMQAVEFVTLAGGSLKVPQLEDASELIDAEMNRSRHYNRSLSIILASLEPDEVKDVLPRLFVEAQEKVMKQYLTARLAETFRGELRRMDMVLEDPEHHRVIVVSPEVDGRGSHALQERLRVAVGRKLGLKLNSGAASYPHMALTFEDLVREAELGMGQNSILQFEDSSGIAD